MLRSFQGSGVYYHSRPTDFREWLNSSVCRAGLGDILLGESGEKGEEKREKRGRAKERKRISCLLILRVMTTPGIFHSFL